MRQKFTVESVLECPNLPGLPTVAMEVISRTREEDVNLREVASRVELDPALTARGSCEPSTVRTSGLGKPVASIQRGIGYMGFNALVSLILGFSLVDMTRRRQDHFDFVGFCRRSTTAAATAGRIAMRIADRVPEHHELTDEAFAAGLLQDIGMLPLQAADPERFRNAEQLAETITILGGYEREAFGFDHATVGAALARRWRLPNPSLNPLPTTMMASPPTILLSVEFLSWPPKLPPPCWDQTSAKNLSRPLGWRTDCSTSTKINSES